MNARPKAAPASPSFSVDGFHVLITGGCGGIGAAIAHGFAAHGAKVTLADLKTPPTDCTAAGMDYAALDVRDAGAIAALAFWAAKPSAAQGRAPEDRYIASRDAVLARLKRAAPSDDPTRAAALDELTSALQSVVAARSKRYVMANVPRAQLDEVRRVLPGITGPTVIDLMNDGVMVAVHSVVDAKGLYRTIRDLKKLGGEGILVTRIERLTA